jgi:small conductance mechanosensitive channel
MDQSTEEIIQTIVSLTSTWGLQVIGAVAVLLVGRFVAGVLRRTMRRALERSKVDASLVPFFSSAVYYLAITVVVIAVLELFGIQTTSMIAVVGAAGLAIGLAMQGTLSNVASGVMLLIFRPFRLGDFVEVAGVAGSVAEIGLFSTALNTPDNVRIIVPNSAIYGATMKNYSANDTRRNDLVIGVAYGDSIPQAIEIVRNVLTADARVLPEPAAVVAVGELGDSSVNLLVRPWCRKEDYWDLRFELTRKLKEELESGGCSIPFPQRDVHLHSTASAA